MTDQEIDSFYGKAKSDRGAASQHESLAQIKEVISDTDRHSDKKVISYLGNNLRKLAMGNIYQVRERIEVYDLVQKTLISIPGHAQYFADELERLREQNPTDKDGFKRTLYISQTLVHMPSPETLKVLGNYLLDERDTPPERNWTPENAHLAAYALSRIGLRDFPFKGALVPMSLTIWPDLKQLPDYRTWWEEIKSGQRTFSFKGQAVEYRFKPDGTWGTIPISNPPDDGPKPAATTNSERPAKRPSSALQVAQETSRDVSWWWYAVVGSVLLALGAWFWKKRTV